MILGKYVFKINSNNRLAEIICNQLFYDKKIMRPQIITKWIIIALNI